MSTQSTIADRSVAAIKQAVAIFALVAVCLLGLSGAAALATVDAPGWQATSRSYPTDLAPGSTGVIRVDVYNVGALANSGPVTVTDVLPADMEATDAGDDSFDEVAHGQWQCTGKTVVKCTSYMAFTADSVTSGEEKAGVPAFPIAIAVKVAEGAQPGEVGNEVTVSGGGGATVSDTDQLTIGAQPAGFGFAHFHAWFSNPDGTLDTQAGSHPYEMTIAFDLNSVPHPLASVAGGEARSIAVNLPPGLVGNPTVVPRCVRRLFDAKRCSADTQVGVATVYIEEETQILQLYNLVPPPGVAAQFGLSDQGIQVILNATVRSGGDYGITTKAPDVPQRGVVSSSVTIWGVPSDPTHDPQRKSPICTQGGCSSGAASVPFLTLPTSCEAGQVLSMSINNWQDESMVREASVPVSFTGCDHLGFGPSIAAAPDTSAADSPAGLTAEVKTSQEGLLQNEGLAASNIENTTVALPAGMAVNPGQAAGLAACQQGTGGQEGEDDVGSEAPARCPLASKVGEDEVETPLLAHALKGNVYVLQSNPPDLKLLVVAAGEGIEVKLVSDVHLNELTGQLTSTFEKTPELPFTNFKLSFSGGAQAALSTPTACGSYTSSSDFSPWTGAVVPDVFPTSTFVIDRGPGGAPCPGSPLPFTPSLTAGSTTDQAGGYTDFSLLLNRPDDQQRISRLQFKTPEGLLGMISKVPLCGEPQAAQGTCPAASQIGHTVVEAGPGPYPLVVPQPGQPPAPIYLTGGYNGAPYGLSIVVPLVVGPFTLQTQVVRASIAVDPHTAQLTVTTDPLPLIIDGIPTDLRTINAVIDKPGFMFNPTGCDPRSFGGTAFGSEGAQAPISSHFQMGSCRALSFEPDFKVSTSGKTSRAGGASLGVKIVYPTGELGANQASSQSNIESVKVELPRKLPSRLTTLQKACTAAQFDANPAGCPAASVVGRAKAITPVLPVALEGPAYFVSHGGEAFPNLIVVLQGYGVTVDLVGDTFISKKGITSSTFKQLPDVPIASFELNLPEGPYSALAANGNLCKAKLKMPTHFVAQNGAELQQSTPITVNGCPKAKKSARSHRRHPAAKGGHRHTGGKAKR